MLEYASVLGAEAASLDDALGRALAIDASAPNDVPPFADSVMDGFAIRAADLLEGAAELELIGEAKAGTEAGVSVRRGTAVRTSTGAPVPHGADAIVPQEMTTSDGARVSVDGQVRVGYDVCPPGEDIRTGAIASTLPNSGSPFSALADPGRSGLA